MCRCGCRGWCSLFPLVDAWVKDLHELQSSNQCAVLDIQCDWPAYLEITGGRFWNHTDHPCPLCRISQAEMNPETVPGITLDDLGHELYTVEDYNNDIDKFTKVWNLTMSMIGNQDTYNLSAKAAESHGLLKFVLWLLHKYSDEFAKQQDDLARKLALLTAAAEAAHAMDDVLMLEFRQFTRHHCQMLLQLYLRFLTLYLKAGGVWRPKCHLLVHMIQRAADRGNPRLYSTYRDESLNGTIAKIARSAHRRTWSNVIHFKCGIFHQKNLDAYLA
ncbi:unnamed protein product [Symbiodinium microadriaticum]|nr:unnamed protein product [Symbiodinium microadriaticum]